MEANEEAIPAEPIKKHEGILEKLAIGVIKVAAAVGLDVATKGRVHVDLQTDAEKQANDQQGTVRVSE